MLDKIPQLHTKITPLSQVFNKTWEKITKRTEQPELPIMSLPRFNRLLWGLHRQKLITIGARTSQGKTAFALQVAWDIADQNHAVYFLSLEQTREALAERLFCNIMRVNNYNTLRGIVNTPEIQRSKEMFDKIIVDNQLILTDCIGSTANELVEIIESMSLKPTVVVVDYVQTIKKGKSDSREAMDNYMRVFRELAIKHNFCAINISQINREAQGSSDPHPQLHHLKGTGVIEEHSDMVLLLHYPLKYDMENEAIKYDYEINIAKNRDGRTGVVKCQFLPHYYKFVTLEDTNSHDRQQIFS